MFPALTEAVSGWLKSRGPSIQTLELKGDQPIDGIGFDPVSIAAYTRNGYDRIAAALGGGTPGWSGQIVNYETAHNHSAVWTCERVISEAVGFLPCIMMQKAGGKKREAVEQPMHSALVNAPNAETTAMGFFETGTGHLLLRGNTYAQIIRRSGTGTAMELQTLLPSQCVPQRDKAKRLCYVVDSKANIEGSGKTYTVERGKPQDILHIRGLGFDGLTGYSVLTMARHSLGTALSAEKFAGKFFANGGRLPYILEQTQKFKTVEMYEQFRADWSKYYANQENMHMAPILEPGQTYKQIGLTAVDSQLLESRAFSIQEVCRWFLLSPHFAGDLSRATFSNIEHLALDFYKRTLSSWLTRWEQELWRCVLTPEEKTKGFYFRHRVDELLRGDFLTRMQGYASALQNGHLSINEVRDLEDRNPVEGGDQHWVQLNLQEINHVGELPATPQRVPVKQPAA